MSATATVFINQVEARVLRDYHSQQSAAAEAVGADECTPFHYNREKYFEEIDKQFPDEIF